MKLSLLTSLMLASCAIVASSTASAASVESTRNFYAAAAQGNLAEISMGQLAQNKSTKPAIRDFAEQMVRSHTEANELLKAAAARNGIQLPTQPDEDQLAIQRRLQGLEDEAFDHAYMDEQLAAHGKMTLLLEMQVDAARDPSTRSYVAAALPLVKEHEVAARRLTHGGGQNRPPAVRETSVGVGEPVPASAQTPSVK